MSFWNIYKVSFLLSFILHDKVTVSDISVSLTQQALNIIKHQKLLWIFCYYPIGHSTSDASVGWSTIYM